MIVYYQQENCEIVWRDKLHSVPKKVKAQGKALRPPYEESLKPQGVSHKPQFPLLLFSKFITTQRR